MPESYVDIDRLLEHTIIGYDYPNKKYVPDRSFFVDAFNTVAAGGLDAVEMVAKALSSAGIPAEGVVNSIRQYKASATWDDPSRQYYEDGARRTVMDILRSASQSLGTRSIGILAGGLAGLVTAGPAGMVGGAAIGATATGGPVYGLSTYYDFMEDAKNHGIPIDTVRNDAILAAVTEGGLEMASDLIFGRLMGLFGKSGKEATKGFMKSLTEKTTVSQFTKKFLLSYAKVASEEIPTELAQDYFGYHIRKNAGLPVTTDLAQSLKQTAVVTAGTSALFALGGLGGLELRKKFIKSQIDAAAVLSEIADNPEAELTEQQVTKLQEVNQVRALAIDEYNKYKEDQEKGRRTLVDLIAIASRLGPVLLWDLKYRPVNAKGEPVLGLAFKGRGVATLPHPLVVGHEIGHRMVDHKLLDYNKPGIPKNELIRVSRLHRKSVYRGMYPDAPQSAINKEVDKRAYKGQEDQDSISEAIGDFVGLYLYMPEIVSKMAPRTSEVLGPQIDRITRIPQDYAETKAMITEYSARIARRFVGFAMEVKAKKQADKPFAAPEEPTSKDVFNEELNNRVGPQAFAEDIADEFDAVSKIIQDELGITDDAKLGFMANTIIKRGGLPEEATARKRYLQTVEWAASKVIKTQKKGITNLFNPWVSIRYGFADLEAKTGVVGLHKDAKSFMYKTGQSHYNSSTRIDRMFRDNDIDPSKLADDPETIKQVVDWLYEKDDKKREAITSKMSPYALKVAKVVHNELQGETATNIRISRWLMWRSIPRKTLEEYLQLYHRVTSNKASREDIKRYGKLQGYFESILPPDLKPEYGVATRGANSVIINRGLTLEEAKKEAGKDKKAYKVVQLTSGLEELLDADAVYESEGMEGLRKFLSTKTWGTRKHYYMSSIELDNALEQFVGNITSPGVLGKHTTPSARPGAKLRESHTRTTEGIPKDAETFLPDLYNHIQRAAMIADVGIDMLKLSDKFMTAMPKTRDANSQIRVFKRFVMNAMGLDESAPVAVRTVEKINRFFWQTYPLAISRILWYSFRNLAQNMIAGGQLNIGEAVKSGLTIATSGPSDLLRKHFSLNFKSTISQKLPIFRHFMMMEHDVVDKKYKRKMTRILDTLGQAIPFSDEVNRMLLFPIVHDIAERNINAYKEGKINFEQLAKRAGLNNLHPQELLDIQDLLKQGNYEDAIFEIAATKVANTHFRYRVAERSGVEQHRTARPLTGLYNWPRGLVESLYYNGIKPFVVGMETKNYNVAFSGLTALTKVLGGMFVARELLKKILGKKDEYGAYDTFNTIFGYAPGSAGLGLAMSVFEDFKRAHDYARDGNIDKAFFTLLDRAAYHLPLIADTINAYEALHDRRGVKMMRLLEAKIYKATKEPGKSAKRTAVEKWQHILFGTEEIPQSEEARKLAREREKALRKLYRQLGIKSPLLSAENALDIDKLLRRYSVI